MCGKALPFRQPENILRLCLVQDRRRSLAGTVFRKGSALPHIRRQSRKSRCGSDFIEHCMSVCDRTHPLPQVVLTSWDRELSERAERKPTRIYHPNAAAASGTRVRVVVLTSFITLYSFALYPLAPSAPEYSQLVFVYLLRPSPSRTRMPACHR
jgi:hypothetical protein